MKNLELRSSLIKSGVLLALCIFFIYAFAVSDSGGIGGTISSLFSGITFLIGLSIALVVSVVVIFGIYFGILYLYNPDVSKKTYEEFKTLCSASTANLPITTKCCFPKKSVTTAPPISTEDLQNLEETQEKLATRLDDVGTTLETLQNSLSNFTATLNGAKEEVLTLEEKTTTFEEALESKVDAEAIDESAKKLSSELESLKGSLKPISDKIAGLEESVSSLASQEETDDEDGDEDVQALIDKAVNNLHDEIKVVQKEITKLSAAPAQTTKTKDNTADDTAHRILSYFSKKADEKKFVASVKKAVNQEMTYAQIGEFLDDTLSKDASAIIADHPSLTKDYIRTIRQKS